MTDALSDADHVDDSRLVLLHAGGLSLAIPANKVRALHGDVPAQPVPGTADWFLGLSVIQGRLLPVTDLGAWLIGVPSRGRIIELAETLGLAALQVDRVRDVASIDAVRRQGRAVPLRDNLDGVLESSVDHDGHRYHVLDVAQLTQTPRFQDVARVQRHTVQVGAH